MDISKKALYNSLCFRAMEDEEKLHVEPWKILDLKKMPLERLFELLKEEGFFFDKTSFKELSEPFDNPEDFTDSLFEEERSEEQYDKVYLLIFELWRKLNVEKPSISIVCDALDTQIFNYDRGELENNDALQDALDAFYGILEENVDHNLEPQEVFCTLKTYLAHDIERFLYDYISDIIDASQEGFAEELIDQFLPFVSDRLWFHFLRARIVNKSDCHKASAHVREIFEESKKNPSLDLYFDMLALLVHGGDYELFKEVVAQVLDLLDEEEDFQELIAITIDFFHLLDNEEKEQKVSLLLQERKKMDKEKVFSKKDKDVELLKQLVSN